MTGTIELSLGGSLQDELLVTFGLQGPTSFQAPFQFRIVGNGNFTAHIPFTLTLED